jgi:endonuclease/exonuclease/phosphatase (EEP) superfamily protein YafD
MSTKTESGSSAEGILFPRIRSLSLALLFALGLGALTGTITGFLGRFWWFFDLTSHFRPQFAAGLLIAAPILLLAKHRWSAGIFGVAGAANALLLAPFLLPGPAQELTGVLKVGVLNLDLFNDRADLVLRELARSDPDVVVFLEFTTEWSTALTEWRTGLPHGLEAPRENPFGIAVASRLPVLGIEEVQIVADAPPAILARLELEGRPLELLAFHPFPPLRKNGTALRDRELQAAAGFIASRELPALVVGDLNASYWSYALRDFLSATQLRPAALGHGLHLTWPTDLPFLQVPIDHVLIPDELGVLEFDRGAYVGSDHYPVWAAVGWQEGGGDAS